jgi:hypothetical protein
MLSRFHSTRRCAAAEAPRSPGWAPVIALAATLAVAVVAAGCGSGSKPTALTKPQFLAKGNAICAQSEKKLESAGNALGNHPSQAQMSAFATGTFIPAIQRDIDEIRALAAPSGEQATVTNMLDVAQTDLNRLKSNLALLASGPGEFANFGKLAHSYGLTECARGS